MEIKISKIKGYHKRLYILQPAYIFLNKPARIKLNFNFENNTFDIIPAKDQEGISVYVVYRTELGSVSSEKFTRIKPGVYYAEGRIAPKYRFLRVYHLEYSL